MDRLPKFLTDIIDVEINWPYVTHSIINGKYTLIDEYEKHRRKSLNTKLPT